MTAPVTIETIKRTVGRHCRRCYRELKTPNTKTGMCAPCAAKNRSRPGKHRLPRVASCLDCGTGITAKAPSGCCRSCMAKRLNASPEINAKRRKGWRARYERSPNVREKMRATVQRNFRRAMLDPAKREAAAERGRANFRKYLDTDENRAKIAASRKRAGAKIRETLLAWCPPEYRELHRRNVHSKRMPAAESRAIIEAKMRETQKRPSTFEEKLKAVAEGRATIIEIRPVRRELERTLAGVPSGWDS